MTTVPSLHNRLLAVAPATPVLGSNSLAYAYDGLHRRVLRVSGVCVSGVSVSGVGPEKRRLLESSSRV